MIMKEDMKKKYEEMYYTNLIENKDKAVMKIWGEKEYAFVCCMIDKYPDLIAPFIISLETSIEAKKWNNYLSHAEMEKVLASLSPKAKWSYEEIVAACKSYNVAIENKPYWNTCALVATMNMLNSDHYETLNVLVREQGEYVELIYNLAVDKLQDPDRANFARPYFQDVIGY